jgi:CheY-like chemotaxis protein
MPDGGRLTIETANVTMDEETTGRYAGVSPGEYVLLSISDTGTGIPEAILPHIFEPFFTSKERGKGTGLGLFTCSAIISQRGGYIDVQSEQGHGTTFQILIPRINGPPPVETPRNHQEYLPRGTETVLLVEDEQGVREVAATTLRAQGYTVLEAAEGLEALTLARGRAHRGLDLLLTDVIMPIMSGRELAKRLRDLRPDIRILYTSGYSRDTVGQVDSQEFSSGFLEKPFTPAELTQKVRSVLER